MYVLHAAFAHGGQGGQMVQHAAVLHLGQPDDAGTDAWQLVCAQVEQGAGHVGQLVLILHLVPVVGTRGQEVIVVLALVMDCIEEVLLIVEGHRIDTILLLGTQAEGCRQGNKQQNGQFSHVEFHYVTLIADKGTNKRAQCKRKKETFYVALSSESTLD